MKKLTTGNRITARFVECFATLRVKEVWLDRSCAILMFTTRCQYSSGISGVAFCRSGISKMLSQVGFQANQRSGAHYAAFSTWDGTMPCSASTVPAAAPH